MRTRVFFFALFVFLVGVILEILGIGKVALYSTFWWYDDLMHTLGGMGAALGAVWLYSLSDKAIFRPRNWLKMFVVAFVGALFIGALWELGQHLDILTSHSAHLSQAEASDINRDMGFNIIGGIIATFIVIFMYIFRH